ncbi:MAG: VWA domain-containing protein, partial [Planctomycetota bacterium]
MELSLADFHFLRPWWLLATPAVLVVWRLLATSEDPRREFADEIAPHLLTHLVVDPLGRSTLRPSTLLLPLWLLVVLALAGPSWRREPTPFADDQATLMVVMRVSQSMKTTDVLPSRLERAGNKVHDLLQIRSGAATGLIAYSGTAHLVMPFTSDADVIDHMVEALDPSVMPEEGDVVGEALELAARQLAADDRPGSILLIADSVEATQLPALSQWRENHPWKLQVFALLGNQSDLADVGIEQAARAASARVQRLTVDGSDVNSLARRAETTLIAVDAAEG